MEDDNEEEGLSYSELVHAFDAEERARASIGSSLKDLKGEMEELLSRRFQVGKHGRFVEPDDLATPQSPDERKQFVFRRCLCGCGESRLCRADAPDGNAQPVSTQWRTSLAETGGSKPVRPSAQRAICERLTRKPPPRLSAATVETLEKQTTPSSESHPGPLRQVDAERLKLLARPREPPPPPEPPAPPPREARRLAQRSSSEPMLCRTPALPPLVEKATGVNGGIGGATGAVLRPPPKRATKLRHSADVTLPGLSDLLRSAETAALAVGRGGLSVVDAESDEETPRLWKTGKVRSVASQKRYTEQRLYKRPGAKPGSLAELEERLARLRAERAEREGC